MTFSLFRFEEAMCSRKFGLHPNPRRWSRISQVSHVNPTSFTRDFCASGPDTFWSKEPEGNLLGISQNDFSPWLGKKKGIKEEPSFLFRFSCQETWCLELWQPFCDHEIKIKRITEKLTQNPQPTHQLCCWVNKTQNHYFRFRLCKQ